MIARKKTGCGFAPLMQDIDGYGSIIMLKHHIEMVKGLLLFQGEKTAVDNEAAVFFV